MRGHFLRGGGTCKSWCPPPPSKKAPWIWVCSFSAYRFNTANSTPSEGMSLFFTPKTPSDILGRGVYFCFFSYQNRSIFVSSTVFVTKSILCCQPGTGTHPKKFEGVQTKYNLCFFRSRGHIESVLFYTVFHLIWHFFIFHTTLFFLWFKNSGINLIKVFMAGRRKFVNCT